MKNQENTKKALETFDNWPLWKKEFTLTKYSPAALSGKMGATEQKHDLKEQKVPQEV